MDRDETSRKTVRAEWERVLAGNREISRSELPAELEDLLRRLEERLEKLKE
jgi:hypothetical protein